MANLQEVMRPEEGKNSLFHHLADQRNPNNGAQCWQYQQEVLHNYAHYRPRRPHYLHNGGYNSFVRNIKSSERPAVQNDYYWHYKRHPVARNDHATWYSEKQPRKYHQEVRDSWKSSAVRDEYAYSHHGNRSVPHNLHASQRYSGELYDNGYAGEREPQYTPGSAEVSNQRERDPYTPGRAVVSNQRPILHHRQHKSVSCDERVAQKNGQEQPQCGNSEADVNPNRLNLAPEPLLQQVCSGGCSNLMRKMEEKVKRVQTKVLELEDELKKQKKYSSLADAEKRDLEESLSLAEAKNISKEEEYLFKEKKLLSQLQLKNRQVWELQHDLQEKSEQVSTTRLSMDEMAARLIQDVEKDSFELKLEKERTVAKKQQYEDECKRFDLERSELISKIDRMTSDIRYMEKMISIKDDKIAQLLQSQSEEKSSPLKRIAPEQKFSKSHETCFEAIQNPNDGIQEAKSENGVLEFPILEEQGNVKTTGKAESNMSNFAEVEGKAPDKVREDDMENKLKTENDSSDDIKKLSIENSKLKQQQSAFAEWLTCKDKTSEFIDWLSCKEEYQMCTDVGKNIVDYLSSGSFTLTRNSCSDEGL